MSREIAQDEKIILQERPAKRITFLWPAVAALITFLVAIMGNSQLFIAMLALLAIWTGIVWLKWFLTRFSLTTERVHLVKLVWTWSLFNKRKMILYQISETGVEQNLLQRMLRVGDVLVDSSAQGRIVFHNAANPTQLEARINKAQQEYQVAHQGNGFAASKIEEHIAGALGQALAPLIEIGELTEAIKLQTAAIRQLVELLQANEEREQPPESSLAAGNGEDEGGTTE